MVKLYLILFDALLISYHLLKNDYQSSGYHRRLNYLLVKSLLEKKQLRHKQKRKRLQKPTKSRQELKVSLILMFVILVYQNIEKQSKSYNVML